MKITRRQFIGLGGLSIPILLSTNTKKAAAQIEVLCLPGCLPNQLCWKDGSQFDILTSPNPTGVELRSIEAKTEKGPIIATLSGLGFLAILSLHLRRRNLKE